MPAIAVLAPAPAGAVLRRTLARRARLIRCRGGRRECHEFSRYWARLRFDEQTGDGRCRLLLGSHGREVEIGQPLSTAQKKELAAELRAQLGAAQR